MGGIDATEAAAVEDHRGERAAAQGARCSIRTLSCTDVDEQAASLREWSQRYAQMTAGPFRGTLLEVDFDGLQIFRESTNQAVHQSGGPWQGARAVGIPLALGGSALFRGEPVDAEAMVTLSGDDDLDFYAPRDFAILGLVVQTETLAVYADRVEHRPVAAAFAGSPALRPATDSLSALRTLLLSVLQTAADNPVALQYPQTQRVLQQSVMAALVGALPEVAAPARCACASRQHVIDAATAYMNAHVAEPITVADVCMEIGVSRRTLQYSFQEVLSLSPVRFLRALRLNGVRRDLRGGGEPAASVHDTAARWGFWHLGHFVTDYKEMFGEVPSETFRRARSVHERKH